MDLRQIRTRNFSQSVAVLTAAAFLMNMIYCNAAISQFYPAKTLVKNPVIVARWIKEGLPLLERALAKDPRTKAFVAGETVNAAVVRRYFGATGQIRCGGPMLASANVMCGGKVLALHGHAFQDEKSCDRTISDIGTCVFETSTPSKKIIIPFDGKAGLKTAFTCKPGTNKRDKNTDWAVVTLKSAVPHDPLHPEDSIIPYEIGDADDVGIGDPLIAVKAGAIDVVLVNRLGVAVVDASGYEQNPKNWSFCEVRQVFTGAGSSGMLGTSCSGSILSSGSGLITRNHQLIAILNSSGEFYDQTAENAKRSPYHAPACSYGPDCGSYYVPVKGDFRDAIRSACEAADR